MSNLSKETIERIEKLAADKTKAKGNEVKDRFYKHSPNKIAFLDGYETGIIEDATEWAGRAQGLVDALRDIAGGKVLPQLIAQQALAKYKEVSNG